VAYTIAQFAADCRAALLEDPGSVGRELARQYTARACADPDFVAAHLGPGEHSERRLLYEDPDLGLCILSHVHKGGTDIPPHDHGPTWAIYGQVAGITEMTDWRLIERPRDGRPGKVAKIRSYKMAPGTAHFYGEGVLHSPRADGGTRLIRIEGTDLTKVKRDRFEAAV
jgi:predicted metal-dependent enzyme (double-stranded beta helix superfamily)